MIELSANIAVSGAMPDVTLKEWNNIKRDSYRELGEEFWRTNLPRRFTWAGARMLGFAKRAPSTIAQKKKRHGNTEPLVNSGVSRRLATTIKDVRATSTKTTARAKITMHARALNFSNPRAEARGVRPSEEVRRIAQKEIGPLVRFLQKRIEANIKLVPFNPKRDQLY